MLALLPTPPKETTNTKAQRKANLAIIDKTLQDVRLHIFQPLYDSEIARDEMELLCAD